MTRLVRSGSGSSSRLLLRILERRELVAAVEKLSPCVLGQLIEHVGLEDAGELVAVASTQQLERVWDRDLWRRSEQDGSEHFDPDRFGLWLAVVLEAGEAQAVQRLRELPLDLLTLGVHRLVQVVEREQWLQAIEVDEDTASSGLHAPWHELLLCARDDGAWDAVLRALLALDEQDHALVRRILERCRALEAQASDDQDDALYSALADDEVLEQDVAAERDERQAATGFVSAADARAFLRLARTAAEEGAGPARDPVTRAYFRELVPAPEADAPADVAQAETSSALAESATDNTALASLLGLLAEAGVVSRSVHAGAPAPALPGGGAVELEAETTVDPGSDEEQQEAPSLLHAALHVLEQEQPLIWSERMEELGYLANVILGGCSRAGGPFEPRAALEAASAVCSLGLELQQPARAHAGVAEAVGALQRVPADRLFRAGYAVLHAEIVCEARSVLQQRCARHAGPEACAQLDEVLQDDDLGALPDGFDAELFHLTPARWDALRALAESVPGLAGTLAARSARFLTTRAQLRAARRLLRQLSPRSRS